MNEYKNIYKSIDGLNNKIKKLENIFSHITNDKSNDLEYYLVDDVKKNSLSHTQNITSFLESYQIVHPKETYSAKKYIGLMFDSNFNNFESDDNTGNKNLIPFIKLGKKENGNKNIIINYLVQFELNYTPLSSNICSLAIGIKTKSDSKIKIIKGSKHIFDLANTPNLSKSNYYTISNIIIYGCENIQEEELCMIVDIGNSCKVNSKKSFIKLLYV